MLKIAIMLQHQRTNTHQSFNCTTQDAVVLKIWKVAGSGLVFIFLRQHYYHLGVLGSFSPEIKELKGWK